MKVKTDRTKRRVKCTCAVTILVLLALVARVGYISLIEGKTYGYMATGARLKRVALSAKRGDILDRNGIPLTSKEITSSKIYVSRNGQRRILTFESLKTKRQTELAKHLIGYLDSDAQKGLTGLQRVYNDELSNTNPPIVEYSQSATGETVLELPEIIENNNNSKNIKTTIDINIQRICEDAFLNSGNKKGAIVVQDVSSSEILAISSFPSYNVDNLEQEMKNADHPFINRAISQYNVGSIFKIVDLMAYFEKFGVRDI